MSLLETQKLKAALSSERQVATRKTSDKASDSHRALDSSGGLRRANSSDKVGTWSTRGSRDVTWTPGVPAVEERASACRAAKRSAARRPCSSPHHHHLPAIAAFAHSVCQTEILPKLVFFFFEREKSFGNLAFAESSPVFPEFARRAYNNRTCSQLHFSLLDERLHGVVVVQLNHHLHLRLVHPQHLAVILGVPQ